MINDTRGFSWQNQKRTKLVVVLVARGPLLKSNFEPLTIDRAILRQIARYITRKTTGVLAGGAGTRRAVFLRLRSFLFSINFSTVNLCRYFGGANFGVVLVPRWLFLFFGIISS